MSENQKTQSKPTTRPCSSPVAMKILRKELVDLVLTTPKKFKPKINNDHRLARFEMGRKWLEEQTQLRVRHDRKLLLGGEHFEELVGQLRSLWKVRGIHRWLMTSKLRIILWEMTDKRMQTLASEISRHSFHLQQLDLDFSSCLKITHQGIKEITWQIGKHLTHLESLNLNFRMCENMTNYAVKVLASGIGNLGQLKILFLDFSFCQGITNEGAQMLGLAIGRCLTRLEGLKISFSYCAKVGDKALRDIGMALQHLHQFEKLSINFSCCDNLTVKGLRMFASEIQTHSTQLKQLYLNLVGCEKLTKDQIESFESEIKSCVPQLEQLRLVF